MRAGELCNRDVVIADEDLSVIAAAKRMRDYHVGDLVVVDDSGGVARPIGIITDRDLVVAVLAESVELAAALKVGDVMSAKTVTSDVDEDVAVVLKRMRTHGVRRMPVINRDGGLEGILTYDDLIEWMAEQLGDLTAVVRQEQRLEEENL